VAEVDDPLTLATFDDLATEWWMQDQSERTAMRG
jgi:hypothetical protein